MSGSWHSGYLIHDVSGFEFETAKPTLLRNCNSQQKLWQQRSHLRLGVVPTRGCHVSIQPLLMLGSMDYEIILHFIQLCWDWFSCFTLRLAKPQPTLREALNFNLLQNLVRTKIYYVIMYVLITFNYSLVLNKHVQERNTNVASRLHLSRWHVLPRRAPTKRDIAMHQRCRAVKQDLRRCMSFAKKNAGKNDKSNAYSRGSVKNWQGHVRAHDGHGWHE